MITIRGIVPGEYIVNVHWYGKKPVSKKLGEKEYVPMPVQVQIEKINPYNVVFADTVELQRKGHEVTVIRFTVDEKGNVSNFNDLDYTIIEKAKSQHGGTSIPTFPGGL